jgi:galactonate dehydratase
VTTSASPTIAKIRWHVVQVSPRTNWSFVEIVDAQGRVGVGEATLALREAEMMRLCNVYKSEWTGRAIDEVDLRPARAAARALTDFAVLSAFDQALFDVRAQQQGLRASDALGGRLREQIPLYANVNRGTGDRTPDGFAAQARSAVAAGHTAVKIAPFDGVELYGDATRSVEDAVLDMAFARIAAVRDAIGAEARLMVDCHWRLNRAVAESVIDAVEPYRLHWLECPVPETNDQLHALRALRSRANERGIRLAGCEQMSLVAGGLRPSSRRGRTT